MKQLGSIAFMRKGQGTLGSRLQSRWLISMLLVVVCMFGFDEAWAQLDTPSSMNWATPTLYNSATAGSDSALHVTAFSRMQWVGIDDAPRTFFVSADMPLKLGRQRAGAGITVLNDQEGLFTTTYVNAQVSMSRKLWGGRLAIGVQPGFVNQTFDGGGVSIPTGDAWDPSDESIPTSDVSGMGFDLGVGAFYELGHYYGGVSVQHVLGTQLELGDYAYTELTPTFYLHGGGNIPLKRTLFILQPSMLVRTTFQFWQVEATMRATYDHKFWGGITYRHGDAVALMVGADVGTIRLGYSYDVGISRMGFESGGSHELLVGWTMHIDLDKKGRHGRKSIRIL